MVAWASRPRKNTRLITQYAVLFKNPAPTLVAKLIILAEKLRRGSEI